MDSLVGVAVFFGLSSLYMALKLHRLESLYKKMMQGAAGESIEQMLLGRIRDIESLKQKAESLQAECERMDEASRKHVQQVGMVRFNAFDNTGSDLSFAVAMLDATDSGFVLSGIYGREESRVYAKPIVKGESTYMLTKEEKQALHEAANKK
jgi:uncharacterized protein (DUF342 family)